MQAPSKTLWGVLNRLVDRQTPTDDSKASAPKKQAVVQQAQQPKGVLGKARRDIGGDDRDPMSSHKEQAYPRLDRVIAPSL